ncbi:MAG TPA: FAD-dependent oxidoreductase, partial [Pilimelia sp.]|nr:FAD-dependent oxidoreductase [Pilimelia sp.]
AGMLAPVAEAYFGERELTALLVAAAADWPRFAADLAAGAAPDSAGAAAEGFAAAAAPAGAAAPDHPRAAAADAGRLLGLRTEGTLVVGRTSDDLAEVDRLRSYQESLGLPVHRLRAAQLRAREPLLAPGVRGGAYLPDDHAVDPRRLVAALRTAAAAAGVRALPSAVARLADVDADQVVVAAGLGVGRLTGLPVRPVKGQVLRLRTPDDSPPGFRHVIRGVVDGRGVYCVPRADGEVVVGATVEERADRLPTAGAALELLRAAVDLIPALTEYALAETGVGHRAGTPDNGPLLGRLDPRTVVAGGFYRHGIVCTPLAAAAVADLVEGRDPAAAWAPFAPDRFVRS